MYTSINNPKIKFLKKLENKKYRDLEDLFLVETFHLVEEAYKKGILKEVFTTLDIEMDVPIYKVSKEVMNYLSSLKTSSKIIGVCTKEKNKKIEGNVLLLDKIQDPGNLGTIIRTAVAFNVKTIIISKDSVDIYNPKVIRATQGMLFRVNILFETLDKMIDILHEKGYFIYATDVSFGKDIKTIEKNKKFAIIMGNEGQGVSQCLKDKADRLLYIPINKECESLNVACATSIILYEIAR